MADVRDTNRKKGVILGIIIFILTEKKEGRTHVLGSFINEEKKKIWHGIKHRGAVSGGVRLMGPLFDCNVLERWQKRTITLVVDSFNHHC